VIQNRWDLALQLAEEYDFPQVEGLLTRYAQTLLLKGKKLEAVELYRRANRSTDPAILIGDIAEQVMTHPLPPLSCPHSVMSSLSICLLCLSSLTQAARKDVHPFLAKRLHVLAALEIERHRKKTRDQAATNATKAGGTLEGGTMNTQNIAMATAATLESLMMTFWTRNIQLKASSVSLSECSVVQ
jgi:WD repeat-containing protein 35